MKNDSQTIQLIMSILFFTVSFSGLIFLYNKIENTEQISNQKLIKWQTEVARRDEIKSLDNLIKKIENEKDLVETHFAESKNPVSFLDAMERLAASVGAKNTVSSIELSGDENSLVVGMDVSGSFESFYKFLMLLENSPYGLEFVSMNLAKDGGQSAGGVWSAALKVKLLTFVK